MALYTPIVTGQFHFQVEGKTHFIDIVSSFKIKLITDTVTILEIDRCGQPFTLSLPVGSVWRTTAKDTTDWELAKAKI